MKKYRLSSHSRLRASQRMNATSKKSADQAFSNAIRYGKDISNFKGPFYNYLQSKRRKGSSIKVHNGMMFIYKNRTLITCYEVPPRYIHYVLDYDEIRQLSLKYNNMKVKQLREQIIIGVRNISYYVFNARRYKVIADKKSFDILCKYILKNEIAIRSIYIRFFGGDLYPTKINTNDVVSDLLCNLELFRQYYPFMSSLSAKNNKKVNTTNTKYQYEMKQVLLMLISGLNYIRECSYFIDVYKGDDKNVKRFKDKQIINKVNC